MPVVPYDIFITVAPKDLFKLKYSLPTYQRFLSGFKGIYVCTPRRVPDNLRIEGVTYVLDKEVLDINPLRFKYRPNWCYQQLLKLFQRVTPNDMYFTVDSDLFFNKPIPLFTNDGRPIWLMGSEQNNQPYFRFQEQMIRVGREHNHTFISDTNFFSRRIIEEMLQRNGLTVASFIEKAFAITTKHCYIGEPELYGNYCHKFHRGMYHYHITNRRDGAKDQTHPMTNSWTEQEIKNLQAEYARDKNIEIFTIHSWCNNTVDYWERPDTNGS